MSWNFQELTKLEGITEGPIWADTVLYFSHIPTSRIMCYHPASGQVFPHITDTKGTNGLMLDQQGFLYACESNGRRVVQYGSAEGPSDICSSFEGRRLNGQRTFRPDHCADLFGPIRSCLPSHGGTGREPMGTHGN